ncbi:MAG: PAS domain-containing protein, partial [Maritimibacter harenae]
MDTDTLWNSLPVPALIIDGNDVIEDANSAAEAFLNASTKSLVGKPILDQLAIATNMEGAFERVRRDQGAMFINSVDVGTGSRAPAECNIQLSPIMHAREKLLMLMEPRKLADRMGKAQGVKSAARSA